MYVMISHWCNLHCDCSTFSSVLYLLIKVAAHCRLQDSYTDWITWSCKPWSCVYSNSSMMTVSRQICAMLLLPCIHSVICNIETQPESFMQNACWCICISQQLTAKHCTAQSLCTILWEMRIHLLLASWSKIVVRSIQVSLHDVISHWHKFSCWPHFLHRSMALTRITRHSYTDWLA